MPADPATEVDTPWWWMGWFILRWSILGMAVCFAVMVPIEHFLWTPPDLVGVIIGAVFVYASWFVGYWWTTRDETVCASPGH